MADQAHDRSDPGVAAPPRPAARGGDLRGALERYVAALHHAYLAAVGDGPPDALPLAQGPFTVAVVAADRLHLLATRDPLPPAQPHERPADGSEGPLRWQVRFFDASVLPSLVHGGTEQLDVTRELGVDTSLYHLLVEVDATLDDHHAMHAGTGLGHAHAHLSRGNENGAS